MPSVSGTVFVLGAGFTRAFLPNAPLLTDDYNVNSLIDKFEKFQHASRILKLERDRNQNGKINIERLMTRLEGRMPYDFEQAAEEEYALLLSEVKHSFEEKLTAAKTVPRHAPELAAFASHCVKNRINCITFNYDDVLDQALWEVRKITSLPFLSSNRYYWHPDGGYGFFCQPSLSSIRNTDVSMDRTSMLLLKLHGSVNWRIKRGYPRPYSIDAIVHHAPWSWPSYYGLSEEDERAISLHLEQIPFIVPPILVKSALVEQPILRLIWSLAYDMLGKAEKIIFVGYSMPVTDIAASFLFSEAIQQDSQISVVNLCQNQQEKEVLRNTYRRVFPNITGGDFEFKDALAWSCEMVSSTTPA